MASATAVPDLAAGRLRQLDVLRGVAILLVLGRHLDSVPTDAPGAIQSAFDLWMRAGWVGVDLFFVLSGFLVSGLLFREYARYGDVRAGRFLLRRGLKIYPAFYVFLIATALYAGTVGTRGFVAEALFIQNYVPGLWDHTWSLAVEEHFYLLLTALILVLVARTNTAAHRSLRGAGTGEASLAATRRDPISVSARPTLAGQQSAAGAAISSGTARITTNPFTPIVPVFIAVAVIALVLRIMTARYGSPWYTHHLCPTHLRVDSLLFGVLLSYLAHYRGPALAGFVQRHRDSLLLASILCLAPACFLPAMNVFMETIGFTLLYLGFGIVLLITIHRPVPRDGKTGEARLAPTGSGFGVAASHPMNTQGSMRGIGAAGDAGGGKTGGTRLGHAGAGFGIVAGRTVDGHGWVRGLATSVGTAVVQGVAWIGVYSYSIYLWHLAVKRWGVPMMIRTAGVAPTGSAALFIYFASAILIGAAMARLIEAPGLALRDRWVPSRSGRAVRPVGLVDSAPIASAYI